MVSKLEIICLERGGEKWPLLEWIHSTDGSIPVAARLTPDEARQRLAENSSSIILRTELPFGFKAGHGMTITLVPGLTSLETDYDALVRRMRLQTQPEGSYLGLAREEIMMRQQLRHYCMLRGLDFDEVVRKMGITIQEYSNPNITGVLLKHPNVQDTYLIFTRNREHGNMSAYQITQRGEEIEIISLGGVRPECSSQELSDHGHELCQVLDIYSKIMAQDLFAHHISYEIEFQLDPILVHQVRYVRPKNYTGTGQESTDPGAITTVSNLCFGKTPPEGVVLTFGGEYNYSAMWSFEKTMQQTLDRGITEGSFIYLSRTPTHIATYMPNAQGLFVLGNPGHLYTHGLRSALSEVPYVVFIEPRNTSGLNVGDRIRLHVEQGHASFAVV
ncbi:hypothetical protein JW930_02565 [Candidatus Woesearchaeota archaeon]|nr:hypothetical protein [Candidatus Woesearchaeota archaeon]